MCLCQLVNLSICLAVYLSICLSTCLSVFLSIYLSIYLPASLTTKLFCENSSVFAVDSIINTATLRDFLNVWIWQCQKQSNSARLPEFSNIKKTKAKQFCRTSCKNGRLSAELMATRQSVLRFVHSIYRKHCACHEKVWPGHTKCCACHTRSSHQTWRSDAPKCILLRKSAPGPPNTSDSCVSCTAPATQDALIFADLLHKPPRLPYFKNCSNLRAFSSFLALPRKTTLQRPKVVRTCCALCILISKFAWRKRAFFQHLILQKRSDADVLFAFWLRHVLCATAACTFSTSPLPKVLRCWFFQKLFDMEMCFAPHRRAIVYVSHLARWLRTRRFSEPTFRPSGATKHWKTQCFAFFLLFRVHASSFFWLFLFSDLLFSSLTFPSSAFPSVHIAILSEVWLLNFLRLLYFIIFCNY